MEDYEKGALLGEGTFGSVHKAVNKKTGQVVALKKIRLGDVKQGVNVTTLREIKLLRELRSPLIINLLEVFQHKKNLVLVFEYMTSDLEAVIQDRATVLSAADVKSYMRMILQALAFCHGRWVLHRDIKPNNMLLAPSGQLKLADFGLAKIFGSPDRNAAFTNQVFARWYRPPELLFGSSCYSSAVDMWAAGCVFGELLVRRPWMPGESDIDQLGKIFQNLGTPTEQSWPGVTQLPSYLEFSPVAAPPLSSIFPKASHDALDLLAGLMALDPCKRLSAEQALAHPYFANAPAPTPPSQLPRPVAREANPLQQAPAPPAAAKAQRPAAPAKAAPLAGQPAGDVATPDEEPPAKLARTDAGS